MLALNARGDATDATLCWAIRYLSSAAGKEGVGKKDECRRRIRHRGGRGAGAASNNYYYLEASGEREEKDKKAFFQIEIDQQRFPKKEIASIFRRRPSLGMTFLCTRTPILFPNAETRPKFE